MRMTKAVWYESVRAMELIKEARKVFILEFEDGEFISEKRAEEEYEMAKMYQEGMVRLGWMFGANLLDDKRLQ